MMRSLYSGVSGLRTHQTKMDVIGNNIANVNTVAYKSSSVSFSELMYQTTQRASGPNATTGAGGVNARQIGLGVQQGAINTNIALPGATQTTNNPYDFAIKGDAFFVVSNGSENFFTRSGAFAVDGGGNLVMASNGFNVMGWGVDATGNAIKQDTVAALKIMHPDNATYPADATSKATVNGIIDKMDAKVNSESGKIMNLQFYDNLGYSYTAKLAVKNIGDGESGKFTVELTDIIDGANKSVMSRFPGITFGSADLPVNASFKADSNYAFTATGFTPPGEVVEITYADCWDATANAGAGGYVSPQIDKLAAAYGYKDKTSEFLALKHISAVGPPVVEGTIGDSLKAGANPSFTSLVTPIAAGGATLNTVERVAKNAAILEYDTGLGTFKGVNGTAGKTLTLGMGGVNTNFKNIEIDFSASESSNNEKNSTIGATAGDKEYNGEGRKLGVLSDISIDINGKITAHYSNNQSKLLGQIAVAEFANPSGLEKQGENLYSATMNSGGFDGIGRDISASGGRMNNGVLEMSNVDLSAEFTEMITTQRGFQANSRIITVSDTMLEELTNLKR